MEQLRCAPGGRNPESCHQVLPCHPPRPRLDASQTRRNSIPQVQLLPSGWPPLGDPHPCCPDVAGSPQGRRTPTSAETTWAKGPDPYARDPLSDLTLLCPEETWAPPGESRPGRGASPCFGVRARPQAKCWGPACSGPCLLLYLGHGSKLSGVLCLQKVRQIGVLGGGKGRAAPGRPRRPNRGSSAGARPALRQPGADGGRGGLPAKP